MKRPTSSRRATAQRAFTLLEVVTVLAILGIVAVLSFIALSASQKGFLTATGKGYQEQVISAELNYAQANGTFTSNPSNLTGIPRTISVVNGPVASTNQVSISVDATTGALGLATTNGSGTCSVQLVSTPSSGAIRTAVSLPTNASCDGASAVTNQLVAASAPGTPTAVAGNASATVTWSAPSSTGNASISGYTVTSSPGGYTCTSSTTTSCTVGGLTNGLSYTFTVVANTVVGPSLPSAASNAVTPATVPGTPTNVTGTPGNTQVVVSWSAPVSTGGSAITTYTVSDGVGDSCVSVGLTTCTVTGLTNGTAYYFTVYATNAIGAGPTSAASSAVTPAGQPDPPTAVVAVAGVTSATVSWTAPVYDGGSNIVSYTVTTLFNGIAQSQTCTYTVTTPATNSCIVTGLSNSTSYTFTVTATNTAGTSVSSAPSNSITTPGIPSPITPAPVIAAANTASTGGQIKVTWSVPSDNGSTITTYTATTNDGHTCQASGESSTTCTITGLTNGSNYTVTVTATNGAGTSLPSAMSNSAYPYGAPGQPTSVAAAATNYGTGLAGQELYLTWTAPASNGSSITSYTVQYATSPYTTWTTASTTSNSGVFIATSATNLTPTTCSASGCILAGLSNGTNYEVEVTAVNAGTNAGPASAASAPTVPYTVPSAPTITGVNPQNSTQDQITWSASSSWGGAPNTAVYTYTVVASPGGASCTVAYTLSTCVISGLSNATSYTFTMTANNQAGASVNSNTSIATPNAPTGLTLTQLNAQFTPSWTAATSAGSGSTISTYKVTFVDATTSGNGGQTCTVTSPAVTCGAVSGFTLGDTYYFYVQTVNSQGQTSLYSTSSVSLANVPSPPGPPSMTTSSTNGVAITANWSAPSVTGGQTPSSYEYEYSTNGTTWTGPVVVGNTTTATISGLAACTYYDIQAAAYNTGGWGTFSSYISAETECAPTAPGTPTDIYNYQTQSHAMSWAASTDGESDTITYTVWDSNALSVCTTTATSCNFVDLPTKSWGSTLTFYVVASNVAAGNSAHSATSAAETVYIDLYITAAGAGGASGYQSTGTEGTGGGGGSAYTCAQAITAGTAINWVAGTSGYLNASYEGQYSGVSDSFGSCWTGGGNFGGSGNSGAGGEAGSQSSGGSGGYTAGTNNGSGSSEHFGAGGGCNAAGGNATSSVGGSVPSSSQCIITTAAGDTAFIGGGGAGCKSGGTQCGTDNDLYSNTAGGGTYPTNLTGGQGGEVWISIPDTEVGSTVTSSATHISGNDYVWVETGGQTGATGTLPFW